MRMVRAGLAVAEAGLTGEVTILVVAAIIVAVVAIIGGVIIIAAAAIMVEVTTMAMADTIGVVTTTAEDLTMGEVTGAEVSGSALDGAGLDGVRGGAPRTIRTMRHPQLLSSSNPRRMSSRSNRRRVTGIIARIQKVTTHMSRTVQAGG